MFTYKKHFDALKGKHNIFKDNILMSDLITIGKLTRELPSGSKEIIEDIVIDGKESEEAFLSGRHSVGDNVAVVATLYPLVDVSLEHW